VGQKFKKTGSSFLSGLEIRVLETEFFKFERALNEDPDHEIRNTPKSKGDHPMLTERLKVLERDPVYQKSPHSARY